MLSDIQTVPFLVSFGVLNKEMGQSDEREGLLILLWRINSGQSDFLSADFTDFSFCQFR
jgi:hypothetical protein